jgi:hypothetical protein
MPSRRSRLWSRRPGGDDSGEELREDGGGEDVCAGVHLTDVHLLAVYLTGVHLTGVHLLQVYISYRRVQLVGVRVLICPGRHTTVLGSMRWCAMVPPNGTGLHTP